MQAERLEVRKQSKQSMIGSLSLKVWMRIHTAVNPSHYLYSGIY